MTHALRRTLKRASASLMLVLALVYLVHAAWHSALAEVAIPPGASAVAVKLDPFVFAETQSGDGLVGCHFFCNHGCPVPPLPVAQHLPEAPEAGAYAATPIRPVRSTHPQPIKAPPRNLA